MVAQTQNMPDTMQSEKAMQRIPKALQQVFMQSNQGYEVEEAPEVACKTFKKGWKFNGMKPRITVPKITWMFRGNKQRVDKKQRAARDDSTELTSVTSSMRDESSRADSKRQPSINNQNNFTTSTNPASSDERSMLPMSIKVPTNQTDHPRGEEKNKAESYVTNYNDELYADTSPVEYLNTMLQYRGYSTKTTPTLKSGYYSKPTHLQLASYNAHLINVARGGKSKALKSIIECGISPNPCNVHGESLVHAVCRRCDPEQLQILLAAGASVQVSDDYGRTPLHDACWRARLSFEMIEMIGNIDLDLFHMTDVRGSVPLAYVHRDTWGKWNAFLESKKDVWWPFKFPSERNPSGVGLRYLLPNARTIPDPSNALHPDFAAMVSAGKCTPKEALILDASQKENNHIAEVDDEDDESCSSDYDSDDDSYDSSDSEYDSDDSSYEDGSDSAGSYDEVAEVDFSDMADIMGRIASSNPENSFSNNLANSVSDLNNTHGYSDDEHSDDDSDSEIGYDDMAAVLGGIGNANARSAAMSALAMLRKKPQA